MLLRWIRGFRLVLIGLVVATLLGVGAVPAAAGPPGPGGARHGGGPVAHGGGDHGVDARPRGADRAARTGERRAARPARQHAAVRPSAATPGPPHRAGRAAARAHRPAPAHARPRAAEPDAVAHQDAPTPFPEATPPPAPRPPVRATPSPRTAERSTAQPRAAVRPLSAVLPGPTAAPAELAAAPLPAPPRATVERTASAPWPALPGPLGHPAFPTLLAAVLLALAGLVCRGDRRDPKLAAAPVDRRDGRTPFA